MAQILPDTAGGSYAIWTHTPINGDAETKLTLISAGGDVISERTVAANTAISLLGDEGTVYSGTSAVNEATWTPKWTFVGQPLIPLHNGGVITHDGADLRWYDGQGVLERLVPLIANSTPSHLAQGEWLHVDQDSAFEGKAIYSVAGRVPVPTRLVSGQIISSNPMGVVRTCSTPTFQADVFSPNEPRWKGFAAGQDYRVKFERTTSNSLWPPTDSDEIIFSVLLGFEMWEAANTESGPPAPINTTFTKVDDGASSFLLKHDETLGVDSQGNPKIGATRAVADPETGLLPNAEILWDPAVTLPTLYKKVALHEIGHTLGLAHFNSYNPGSVMNNGSEYLDFRNLISQVVTVCDRDAARQAAIKVWVP